MASNILTNYWLAEHLSGEWPPFCFPCYVYSFQGRHSKVSVNKSNLNRLILLSNQTKSNPHFSVNTVRNLIQLILRFSSLPIERLNFVSGHSGNATRKFPSFFRYSGISPINRKNLVPQWFDLVRNLQTFCSSDVYNLFTSNFSQYGCAQQEDCIILQAISQSEPYSQQRSSGPAFPESADYAIRLWPGFNRGEVVMGFPMIPVGLMDYC